MNASLFTAVVAAIAVGTTSSVEASFYCSEPSKPFCIDGSGYFDDRYEAESCQSEVERFISDVEEYISCLDDAKAEQIDAANRAVEQFNCRIEGGSFC